jgi:hypothetical protein
MDGEWTWIEEKRRDAVEEEKEGKLKRAGYAVLGENHAGTSGARGK